jgi:hypothetical protein
MDSNDMHSLLWQAIQADRRATTEAVASARDPGYLAALLV